MGLINVKNGVVLTNGTTITGDKAVGMVGSRAALFPGAQCRRCAAHFIRLQWSTAPAPGT